MTVLKHPLPSAQGFVGFEKQKVLLAKGMLKHSLPSAHSCEWRSPFSPKAPMAFWRRHLQTWRGVLRQSRHRRSPWTPTLWRKAFAIYA
ncbi:unnamed protein product [Cuscuta campestris]|uniref:Uncharacterized protein n=1 Tax=Cuscuta campestris TaxID=132261 RepID=A0A484MZK9_9ASTE|nr:unnamed protein product [Cuscuta campestris]